MQLPDRPWENRPRGLANSALMLVYKYEFYFHLPLRGGKLIKVSVIVPTLNAGSDFEQVLCRLHEQNNLKPELIVIDSGSTDSTAATARKYCDQLLFVKAADFDHGGTRNIAARASSGEYLVFMTQDALPLGGVEEGKLLPKLFLSNLLKPLKAPDCAVSYARQVPEPGASLSEQYLRQNHYPERSSVRGAEEIPAMGIRAFQNSNVCAAYRRDIFEQLKGFHNPAVSNEDMLYAAKAIYAGYRVAYSAEAVVRHSHNFGCATLFRRYFDISASLDQEPRLRTVGAANQAGRHFLKGQLKYFACRKMYHLLPLILLEAGAKYLGFKAGQNHTMFPTRLKKQLGLNTTYWKNAETKQ